MKNIIMYCNIELNIELNKKTPRISILWLESDDDLETEESVYLTTCCVSVTMWPLSSFQHH